ncbi:hypothetical protein N9850_04160 [Granulosicoccus sp.]|nr:hypothetical protein [Granulosicoccus sp.]MDB4222943.1 hypothetical protein [Granulosicoccus sp.]
MTKHTLFLLHGMGDHQSKQWSEDVWNKLVECSNRYKHFETTKALDAYAEPFPIEYDTYIRNALSRWDAQATSFGEFVESNNVGTADSLDWLSGVGADDVDFKISHIADVIVCRYFPLEYGQIRANVQLEIFKEIREKRNRNSSAKFSVMAHSLGTSVAHDALATLGSATKIGDDVNTFSTENFRFHSIHMLANVSRLLEQTPKAYESVVRPGASSTRNRYCNRMYCHDHELDPFTKPKPFDPVTWGSGFRMSKLNHYRGWNIHGWLHYLDNPRVHIPLLKSITKTTAISPKQEREAVNDYPRYGDDLENIDEAKDQIATLHSLAQRIDQDRDVRENIDDLKNMWIALNTLKDLAGDTWSTLEGSVS